MSAQASVEATFDDPLILEGYGFSFFGTKGYTFSPVFARDHVIVQFQGHFVDEIPDDKFTVVLKKVRGEDSVPLFQTLTFHIAMVHPPVLAHHAMALYDMGGQAFDFVSEKAADSTTQLYALVSFASLMLLFIASKVYSYCRGTKTDSQTIEAFAYDENVISGSSSKESSKIDQEPETEASYHDLAGARNAPASAVF